MILIAPAIYAAAHSCLTGIGTLDRAKCLESMLIDSEGEKQVVGHVNELIRNSDLSDKHKNDLFSASPQLKLRMAKIDEAQLITVASLDKIYAFKILSLEYSDISRLSDLNNEEMEKLGKLDRSSIKRIATSPNPGSELQKIQLLTVRKQDMNIKRIVSREDQETAVWEYLNAQQRYIHQLNEYHKVRVAYLDAQSSDDEAALMFAVDLYMRSVARIAKEHLTKIKYRAEGADYITAEEADIIITGSSTSISQLDELVRDLDRAETNNDYKKVAKNILNLWRDLKLNTRIYVEMLLNAQTDNTIKGTKQLENKINCLIVNMESQGVDSGKIIIQAEKISTLILAAENEYIQSVTLLEDKFITAEIVHNARTLTLKSYDKLEEAHALVKQVYKEIANKGISLDCTKTYPELDSSEVFVVCHDNCSIKTSLEKN